MVTSGRVGVIQFPLVFEPALSVKFLGGSPVDWLDRGSSGGPWYKVQTGLYSYLGRVLAALCFTVQSQFKGTTFEWI